MSRLAAVLVSGSKRGGYRETVSAPSTICEISSRLAVYYRVAVTVFRMQGYAHTIVEVVGTM